MPRLSSALLLFRWREARLEVLLVHMGGPFWRRRDAGAWSLPKGEHEPGEDSLLAARREFGEELGTQPPGGAAMDLGSLGQPSGKLIHAWATYGYGIQPKEEQENPETSHDKIMFGHMFFDAETGELFLFAPTRKGRWILTGSQEAPLMRGVTESLAGRAAVFQLLPLATIETPRAAVGSSATSRAIVAPVETPYKATRPSRTSGRA